MLLTRTPLRITLGGGGTDIPGFYREHGGFLIGAAIDKYVYCAVNHNFDGDLLLRYSQTERVATATDIQHPLARWCFAYAEMLTGVEVSVMADIPAGTGLGSSGAFTVGLLNALSAYNHKPLAQRHLAARACAIEMHRLGAPVGKQDPYIAALGGVTALQIDRKGNVEHYPVSVPPELEENLLLFYTGLKRSAPDELSSQPTVSKDVLAFGQRALPLLVDGHLDKFADLLNEQWAAKYERAHTRTHDLVNEWLRVGLNAGALGGKLVGAGGGGFLLFYSESKSVLRGAMNELGLPEVRFRFDYEGTRCL